MRLPAKVVTDDRLVELNQGRFLQALSYLDQDNYHTDWEICAFLDASRRFVVLAMIVWPGKVLTEKTGLLSIAVVNIECVNVNADLEHACSCGGHAAGDDFDLKLLFYREAWA
jgi:hypothetical protein